MTDTAAIQRLRKRLPEFPQSDSIVVARADVVALLDALDTNAALVGAVRDDAAACADTMRRPHQLRPMSPSEARAAFNAGLRREATMDARAALDPDVLRDDGAERGGKHMSRVQSATVRGNVRVMRGDIVRWQHNDPSRPMTGSGEIVNIMRGSSWTGTRLIVRTPTGDMLVFANEATLAGGAAGDGNAGRSCE